MFNVAYNFVGKCIELFIIFILFILNTLFKRLCFSSKPKKARFYFNYFMYILTFFLTGIFFIPLFVFKGRNLDNAYRLMGVYEYLGMKVLGIQMTVRNSKVLAKDQAAVIVVNHQSSLEILFFFQIWRKVVKKMVGVSKKALLYFVPYGPLNYLVGTMFISRNKGGYEDLNNIAKEIVKDKAKALIMPEGTRNHKKGTMLPFKKGAFYLAIKAQVPIIPVAISPLFFIDYEKPSFEQPRLTMQVLEEVPTTGMTLDDVPALTERVRQQIWDAYNVLYQECMDNPENKENDEYTTGFVITE